MNLFKKSKRKLNVKKKDKILNKDLKEDLKEEEDLNNSLEENEDKSKKEKKGIFSKLKFLGEKNISISEKSSSLKQSVTELLESTNLSDNAEYNFFSFISLNNGAGAKTIVSQLAYILSEKGFKVGVLDCNFFQPGLSFMLSTPVTREQSIVNYFKSDLEVKDCFIQHSKYRNLWFASSSPLDYVIDLSDLERTLLDELLDYTKKTFDFVLLYVNYIPCYEVFIHHLKFVDRGYIIWDYQTDNIIWTKSLLQFVHQISNKANSINNIILNKATEEPFDYSKVSEVECNLISELPFVKEIQTCKNTGKLYLSNKFVDMNYVKEFQKILDDMLRSQYKEG